MPKFTFICEHEYTPSKTTVEFEGETINEVLDHVEYFLRGAGYHFVGQLDFVNDDFTEEKETDVEPESNFFWPFPPATSDLQATLDFGAAQPVTGLDLNDSITVTIK